MTIWELIYAQPALLVIVVTSTLGIVISIVTALVVIVKSSGNVAIGKLKINGRPVASLIMEAVRLEVQKIVIARDAKHEQRSIVREGVSHSIERMKYYARKLICEKADGCSSEEPSDMRDYRHIAESCFSVAVAKIMNSVDRNHYAERTEEQWKWLKLELFDKVFTTMETHFTERYFSDTTPIQELGANTRTHIGEYKEIFDKTMDRCRAVSIKLNNQVDAIDVEVKALMGD